MKSECSLRLRLGGRGGWEPSTTEPRPQIVSPKRQRIVSLARSASQGLSMCQNRGPETASAKMDPTTDKHRCQSSQRRLADEGSCCGVSEPHFTARSFVGKPPLDDVLCNLPRSKRGYDI